MDALIWADDDEIAIDLRTFAQQENVFVIDPLVATACCSPGPNPATLVDAVVSPEILPFTLISVVWLEGHWVPWCCTVGAAGLVFVYGDEDDQLLWPFF